MIITFPNVIFRWHNARRGICGIEDYITDFYNLKYGYELTEGQLIYCIQYDGLSGHSFIMYDAEIAHILPEGLIIRKWQSQGWKTDDALYYGLVIEDGGAFLPWKFNDADLQLEPCPSFFENYKAKDLINHTARLNEDKFINGKWIKDRKGNGIFYQHGGWRTTQSKYKDNIDNIVKLGQLELNFD